MASDDTLRNAVIGALATIVLSFVPFSPVLGGAIAAYLDGGTIGDGLRIGALSGAIASIPAVGVLFLLFAVVPFIPDPLVAFGALSLLLLIVGIGVGYFAVLSALGGVVGILLRDEL